MLFIGAMNGGETLVHTLAGSGISVCFANPGTSEMHFVAALDAEPRLRGVLCLQEGVVAGAADGYARMTGTPAAALLHLGPGFANAISEPFPLPIWEGHSDLTPTTGGGCAPYVLIV